jgi:hypothetical protein
MEFESTIPHQALKRLIFQWFQGFFFFSWRVPNLPPKGTKKAFFAVKMLSAVSPHHSHGQPVVRIFLTYPQTGLFPMLRSIRPGQMSRFPDKRNARCYDTFYKGA